MMRFFSLAITALATLPALACKPELPGGKFQVADGKHYAAAWRTQPETVVIGKHFTMEIALCQKDGAAVPESLRVDAHMPEHRHGMNYKTKVTQAPNAAPGRYAAEGFLFHMPGRWEYIFEVRAPGHSGTSERLTTSVVLK